MAGWAALAQGIAATNEIIGAGINNLGAYYLGKEDRRENYEYGEQSAENADARTRALYNDFYSPEALLKQYNKAGLSPSMMYGGTPGQGGMSGAQGSGAGGVQTHFAPMSMVNAAQAAALFAQAEKTKEETSNIKQDTRIKEIKAEFDEMAKNRYSIEYNLTTAYIKTGEGGSQSLAQLAQECFTYDEFIKTAKELAEKSDDKQLARTIDTEDGQKTMRSIYIAGNRLERDIAVLSEETISSNFQQAIVSAMKDTNFAELNAQAAIQYLKQNIQTGELTETQKEAWNNLINKLGSKGSTTRDIVVVLAMILNQGLSNWHMPNFGKNKGKKE